eukprot:1137937-Pelagomonas_calceolata.AAC.5
MRVLRAFDFSLARPSLQQLHVGIQAVSHFFLQHNEYFMSELLNLLWPGVDQPQADQPTVWLKVSLFDPA